MCFDLDDLKNAASDEAATPEATTTTLLKGASSILLHQSVDDILAGKTSEESVTAFFSERGIDWDEVRDWINMKARQVLAQGGGIGASPTSIITSVALAVSQLLVLVAEAKANGTETALAQEADTPDPERLDEALDQTYRGAQEAYIEKLGSALKEALNLGDAEAAIPTPTAAANSGLL